MVDLCQSALDSVWEVSTLSPLAVKHETTSGGIGLARTVARNKKSVAIGMNMLEMMRERRKLVSLLKLPRVYTSPGG